MDDSSVLKGCLIRAVFVRWWLWPQQGGICVGAVLGVWNESGSFCMSLECFANSIPELKIFPRMWCHSRGIPVHQNAVMIAYKRGIFPKSHGDFRLVSGSNVLDARSFRK